MKETILLIILSLACGCAKNNDTEKETKEISHSTATVVEKYFQNQINAVNKAKEATKELEKAQNEHFKMGEESGK
ncbi:MAG TPA: hypothetical protein PK103_06985 [Elusimicrobiales bacterium]|nr:hypothetical protein [Elusimicrobiales bacterium]HOL63095.1 hypothetical protein [Elusimicrobiales bacterium]HPO95892.1 hypothetical protein [Elusimicrobiales bacterium]